MLDRIVHNLAVISFVLCFASADRSWNEIPSNLNQWTYSNAADLERPLAIWHNEQLRHAFSVVGYNGMRRLFDRLQAGLPIIVVAFGDSIVKDQGGCYHRDRQVHAWGTRPVHYGSMGNETGSRSQSARNDWLCCMALAAS